MKTLWQKLKPEIKQTLKDQQDKYPSMIEGVKISLKENYFWSHLTIGEVRDIIYFTDYTYASLSSYDWSYGEKFINADE
jgi:hypothetical protein